MDETIEVKQKNAPRIVYLLSFAVFSYLGYLAWNVDSYLLQCCSISLLFGALISLWLGLFYDEEITTVTKVDEDYLENQPREVVLKWLEDHGGELRTYVADEESEVEESEDSPDTISEFREWISNPKNEKLQFDSEFEKFNQELEQLLEEERYDDAIEYCEKFGRDWFEHYRSLTAELTEIWYQPSGKLESIKEQMKQRRAPKASRHITQAVKDSVWRRDKGICTQCGSNRNLEFDHIIPYSKKGSNTYRNIQILCQDCNRKKSDKLG